MSLLYLNRKGRQQIASASWAMGFGIEFPAFLAAGYFGGRWLDGKFGTEPWLMWVGLGFGFFGAGTSLYRLWKRAKVEMQTPEDQQVSTEHDEQNR